MSNPQQDFQHLTNILSGWQRWQRLRLSVVSAAWGLLGGLLIALLALPISMWQHWILADEFSWLTATLAAAGALIGFLAAWLFPFPEQKAARYFDKHLKLKARLTTSLEFYPASVASQPTELVTNLFSDTVQAAQTVKIRESLPLRLPLRQLAAALFLASLLVLIQARGDQFFQAAATQREIVTAIEKEIAELENLEALIQADEQLDPQVKAELLAEIQAAQSALETAETLEQAVAGLNKAGEQLEKIEGSPEPTLAVLEALGETLSQSSNSDLQSTGDALQSGDMQQAADALQDLAGADLSEEESAHAAQALQAAAQALSTSNPDLAQTLNQAAQALAQQNQAAANQALQAAAETLNQQSQSAAAQAASQAASQIAASQQALMKAGNAGAASSGNQNGNPQAGQNGSSNGQSSQGGAGGGAGRGDGEGSNENSNETGTSGIQQGNGPGDGGESAFTPLDDPTNSGLPANAVITLPQSGVPGEQVLGTSNSEPGQSNPVTVPYTDVYAQYADIYHQAIDNPLIPVALRPLIRDYFSSLEP